MHPISTTWTTGSSSTNYADGQTIQQWIDNAIARAKSNLSLSPPSTSHPITTSWTASDGAHTVSTEWDGSETVSHWIDRHFDAVKAEMANHPPIP